VTIVSKVKNTLPRAKRSEVLLTNSLVDNEGREVVFKHLLTYYFENGRVYNGPSGFVFWELFMGCFKI